MKHICKHEFKDGKMVIPKPAISPDELGETYARMVYINKARNLIMCPATRAIAT
jgi:hypothetical protein